MPADEPQGNPPTQAPHFHGRGCSESRPATRNLNKRPAQHPDIVVSVDSSRAMNNLGRPRQVTVHINGVETLLQAQSSGGGQLSYGTISGPGRAVYVHVDDHLPWPASHQRRRARSRRSGCNCLCVGILWLIIFLALLCGVAAGLLLAWEHRRQLWYTLQSVAAHFSHVGHRIILWLVEAGRSISHWVGDRLRS
jgi:hypothetical protein